MIELIFFPYWFLPHLILDFNPFKCKKYLKNNKHCDDVCDGEYNIFDKGEQGKRLRYLVKRALYHEFFLTKINKLDYSDESNGIYGDDKINKKAVGENFNHFDNYRMSDLKQFVSIQKKRIARMITSMIITKKNNLLKEAERRKIVKIGIMEMSRVFGEINNAIDAGKMAYASELMFYAGRMFERTCVIPHENRARTGKIISKASKATSDKLNKRFQELRLKYQPEIDNIYKSCPKRYVHEKAAREVGDIYNVSWETVRKHVKNPARQ